MTGLDWLFVGMGAAAILYAFFVFRNPSLALRGRKARAWVAMMGEEKTMKLGRYVGVPLTLLIGAGLITMGFTGEASKMQERSRQRQSSQP